MSEGLFWANQGILDILYCAWGLALFCSLPLIRLYSSFSGFLFSGAKTSRRSEDFHLLLSHFIAPRLFIGLVNLLNTFVGTSLFLYLLLKWNYLPWTLKPTSFLILGGLISLGILIYIYFRRLIFGLFSWTFMSKEETLLIRRDYMLLSYGNLLFMLVLFAVFFMPIPNDILLWTCAIWVLIFILLRVWIPLHAVLHSVASYVYLFSYLCAYEFLPSLYLVLVLRYLYENNYLIYLLERI